jgi:hypothetical protein
MRRRRRGAPPFARAARGLAAAAVVGALGWKIIAFAAADLLAASDPVAALVFVPADPTASVFLAERLLSKRPAEIDAAARQSTLLLRRDPLAPGALSLLGAAAAQKGEAERATRMFEAAGAHLPIDLVAHGALYGRAVSRGDVAAALSELDILLRGRLVVATRVGASLGALLETAPQSEAGLADLLATAPPWRGVLFAQLATDMQDADVLIRLHDRLCASAAPPGLEETRALLDRLLRDRRFDAAYRVWSESLPPERRAHDPLYNGRFQFPLTGLPFDWQIAPARGAAASVEPRGGEGVLTVDFSGARIAVAPVRHLLALPAGDYVFSGLAAAQALEAARGLRWRLACLDDPSGALGATESLSGTVPPRPFEVAFSVPADGCATQTLLLELPARIAAEMQIGGTARFSRLAIVAAPSR